MDGQGRRYNFCVCLHNANWGDKLTSYRGEDITYDEIGNPLSYYNGKRYTFTWENGRRLETATVDGVTLTFTYNADGIRTSKTVGGSEHIYHLNGTQIITETWTQGQEVNIYLYDAEGSPIGMKYRSGNMAVGEFEEYWFEKNLQGDIVAVYDAAGTKLISYTYDAWGNFTTTYHDAYTATSHAGLNPFRYRGYYYDSETGLYYLQSRYYDPVIGRFINLDAYVSTGQGILGNNMFTYCGNNPVNRTDCSGHAWYDNVWNWITSTADDVKDWVEDKVESAGEWAYQLYYNATKWHFEDRIDANGEHPAYSQVESDEEWSLLPRDQSLYHIDDVGKDELKFVHPDGREAVFNGDTLEPMLDSRYMATYNYVALMPLPDNPGMMDYIAYGVCWVGHGVTDVLPYWILGMCNTREDFEAKIIAKFE